MPLRPWASTPCFLSSLDRGSMVPQECCRGTVRRSLAPKPRPKWCKPSPRHSPWSTMKIFLNSRTLLLALMLNQIFLSDFSQPFLFQVARKVAPRSPISEVWEHVKTMTVLCLILYCFYTEGFDIRRIVMFREDALLSFTVWLWWRTKPTGFLPPSTSVNDMHPHPCIRIHASTSMHPHPCIWTRRPTKDRLACSNPCCRSSCFIKSLQMCISSVKSCTRQECSDREIDQETRLQ